MEVTISLHHYSLIFYPFKPLFIPLEISLLTSEFFCMTVPVSLHMSEIIWHFVFWLISLSVISFSYIHAVAKSNIYPFLISISILLYIHVFIVCIYTQIYSTFILSFEFLSNTIGFQYFWKYVLFTGITFFVDI